MRNALFFLTVGVFMVHCQVHEAPEVQQLRLECIEVHDEVMPRIGEVNSTSRRLKKYLALHLDESHNEAEIETLSQVREVVFLLDSAHNAMMDWMAFFNPSAAADVGNDSAQIYYRNELVRIRAVANLINLSIFNANEVLERTRTLASDSNNDTKL